MFSVGGTFPKWWYSLMHHLATGKKINSHDKRFHSEFFSVSYECILISPLLSLEVD